MSGRSRRGHLIGDGVRGLMSGLFASWVMQKAQTAIGKLGSEKTKAKEKAASSDEPATHQAAQALVRPAGIALSERQKAKGGTVVHYAYGAGWGAVYGLVGPRVPFPRLLSGLLFGGLLWLVSDEVLVPLFGFSRSPRQFPASVHLKALAIHLVFGATTAAGGRLLPGGA